MTETTAISAYYCNKKLYLTWKKLYNSRQIYEVFFFSSLKKLTHEVVIISKTCVSNYRPDLFQTPGPRKEACVGVTKTRRKAPKPLRLRFIRRSITWVTGEIKAGRNRLRNCECAVETIDLSSKVTSPCTGQASKEKA